MKMRPTIESRMGDKDREKREKLETLKTQEQEKLAEIKNYRQNNPADTMGSGGNLDQLYKDIKSIRMQIRSTDAPVWRKLYPTKKTLLLPRTEQPETTEKEVVALMKEWLEHLLRQEQVLLQDIEQDKKRDRNQRESAELKESLKIVREEIKIATKEIADTLTERLQKLLAKPKNEGEKLDIAV